MIDAWEAVMIGVILLVLLTWGPQKIPELARAVGQARNEFAKASRGDRQDPELPA